MKLRLCAIVSLALLATGCATGPDRKPGDPLEPVNRQIFRFNDALDRTVATPIARGYQKVTPQGLRTAISNFFSNIGDLGNAANALMQLKITEATTDVMRFSMNTVFGLGGLIDFATPAGLPKRKEDFGLTLGHYGVPAGPYLVLPLFGPSSVRDSTGFGVDFYFSLTHYMEPAVRNPMYGANFVSARSDALGATDLLQQAALDKYSFVRDAYTQQRQSLIRAGGTSTSAPLPDYGDPDDSGNAPASSAAPAGSGASGGVPNYEDPGDDNAQGASGAAGAPGAAAPAGAAPKQDESLPHYDDPGDNAAPSVPAAPAAPASTAAPSAAPADVPNTAAPAATPQKAQ